MGCGVSTGKTEGSTADRSDDKNHSSTGKQPETTPTTTSKPLDTRGNTTAPPQDEGKAERSATAAGGTGAAKDNVGKDGATNNNGAGSAATSATSQALTNVLPPAANSFTTYNMTDYRGCKVVTVIQNKAKVETMCKWLDNMLKSREEAGGRFKNPQDSASRGMAANNDSTRETSSISSRTVFSRSAEYSMASQAMLGVSTTNGESQSRGNMTTAAQMGSDNEDNFSPTTRVEHGEE